MNRIFKLLIKCILALIPLWMVMFYIAIRPLSYLSTDSVGAYWNKDFTTTKQAKYYDVVILGDSMAATSFMPELLSDTTINLALSGSSPVEGYYTLKDYLDNNEAPTDVFVSYMDYHLAHDDFTFDTCNQIHKFSLGDYLEIYKTIKSVGANQFENVNVDDYWQDAIASNLYLPSGYIASIINSIKEGGRLSDNTDVYNDIDIHAGRYCHMTNDISDSSGLKYEDFTISALQGSYYKKLVDLCESNEIKLHIIKLPLDRNTIFTDEYSAKVNGYYMTMLADTKYAEFKWYPADYAVEWFWDDYHMNQHGSLRFSMQLKGDYPDIWADYGATSQQMLAINEDINIENELPEIFKWIDQKDYTVLLYFKNTEDPEGTFNAFFKYNDQYIERYDDNVFVLNGTMDSLSITDSNDELIVDLADNNYQWIDYDKYDVNLLIIDNKNNHIVRECGSDYDAENDRFFQL